MSRIVRCPVARLELREQHTAPDERLEAPAVAAPAERAVVGHDHVPDLPRDARAPVEHVTSDDQPAAHAVRHAQVDDVSATPAGTEPHLRERTEVDVVVHVDRDAEPLLEDLRDDDAVPAAQDPDRRYEAGAHVDGCRYADSDREHLPQARVDGLDHLGEQERRALETRVGPVVGRERHALLGDDAVGHVRQRDPQRAGVEVDPGDEPEVARERDLLCAPAAARRGRGVQHTDRRELLDDVRHGRRRQPCHAGQLDLREGAPLLNCTHDPGPVGFTE
jgi:hypothetical protein